MTELIAASFNETGDTIINYGTAGNWSLSASGSTVTRVTGYRGTGLRAGTGANIPPNVGQTAQRTLMCWLKGPLPNLDWPIQYYNAGSDTGVWGILIQSGQIRFRGRDASNVIGFAGVNIPADMNDTWHHVAGTYDGSNIRMYLDGVIQMTTPFTGIRTDGVLEMLGYSTATTMDELRIHDVALSQAEIQALMGTEPGAVTTPSAYYYSGSAWVPSDMKVWNGTSWT